MHSTLFTELVASKLCLITYIHSHIITHLFPVTLTPTFSPSSHSIVRAGDVEAVEGTVHVVYVAL